MRFLRDEQMLGIPPQALLIVLFCLLRLAPSTLASERLDASSKHDLIAERLQVKTYGIDSVQSTTSTMEKLRERREAYAKLADEKLKEAQAKVEKTSKQSGDRNEYMKSLIALSQAYRGANQPESSKQTIERLVSFFISSNGASLTPRTVENIWRELDVLSDAEYQNRFLDMFKVSEHLMKDASPVVEDNFTQQIIFQFNRRTVQDSSRKTLLRQMIEIRSAARGSSSPSLAKLYTQYAAICERDRDFATAEQYYKLSWALGTSSTSQARADNSLLLAQMYARNRVFDKAEQLWTAALRSDAQFPSSAAIENLLQTYGTVGDAVAAQKLEFAVLGKCYQRTVTKLDTQLLDQYNNFIQSGSFEKAFALSEARVKAGERFDKDPSLNTWRLKLSDALLATGNRARSDQLFNQVRASTALQGAPTDALDYQRATLIERLKGGAPISTSKETSSSSRTLAPTSTSQSAKTVRFVLLAEDEISLGFNTYIMSTRPGQTKRQQAPAQNVGICCLGGIHKEGNLTFSGPTYERDYIAQTNPAHHFTPRGVSAPIPAGVFPLPEANVAPAGALEKAKIPFKAGSYKLTKLTGASPIVATGGGKWRIYLVDGSDSPVEFNVPMVIGSNLRPDDLQIWYSGIKTLKVSNQFTGLIYAPHATVEVGFNSSVTGAIVARRIIGAGNNRFTLPAELKDVSWSP